MNFVSPVPVPKERTFSEFLEDESQVEIPLVAKPQRVRCVYPFHKLLLGQSIFFAERGGLAAAAGRRIRTLNHIQTQDQGHARGEFTAKIQCILGVYGLKVQRIREAEPRLRDRLP